MCKLSINDYMLDKSKHVIDAINHANQYKRELLEMIQRTTIPMVQIDEMLYLTPENMEYPKTISDIIYNFENNAYCIHLTATLNNGKSILTKKCILSVPADVFNLNDIEQIERHYHVENMKSIIQLLKDLEDTFAEQLERIKPLRQMILDNESISKIGGIQDGTNL